MAVLRQTLLDQALHESCQRENPVLARRGRRIAAQFARLRRDMHDARHLPRLQA